MQEQLIHLDRELTASLLGFYGPTLNSMDSVSDRDYLIEFLCALSTIMMHLKPISLRKYASGILTNTDSSSLDDAFSTGSSIMPQKKNPDIAELVRGKTGQCIRCSYESPYYNEGYSSCLQQRYAGR